MGTRLKLARVGVAVWVFVAVVSALAYLMPHALLDAMPATIANVISALG